MTRLALLTLLGTVVVLGQQPALVIPHFADGGGWRSSVAVFNSFDGDAVHVSIVFHSDSGEVVSVPVNNYGVIRSLEIDLAPQSSIFLETLGTAPNVQVGWVEVAQRTGGVPVKGYAVFRQTVPGRPDFEAVSVGMRAAGTMTFPFDNTGGLVTSFAVVNLAPATCTIAVSPIYDEFGNPVTTEKKLVGSLYANGHISFISTDKIPELANKRGYLTMAPLLACGAGGFATVGLRFNPSGPFTSLAPLNVSTQ